MYYIMLQKNYIIFFLDILPDPCKRTLLSFSTPSQYDEAFCCFLANVGENYRAIEAQKSRVNE